MGKSLNHYASRVALIIGQPENVFIKERIKDSIKEYFAKFIIQSIDRNGIHEYYKLPLIVKLEPVEATALELDDDEVFYRDFISVTELPKPMNIKNDSPFTKVAIPDTNIYFGYKSKGAASFNPSRSTLPTWGLRTYTLSSNKLKISRKYSPNINQSNTIEKVEIEAIWENPEEVLGYYALDDNQDYPLPFPDEMMSIVLSEMLRLEFGVQPTDSEINKM